MLFIYENSVGTYFLGNWLLLKNCTKIVLKPHSFRYDNYAVSVLSHIKKLHATLTSFPICAANKNELIAAIELPVGRYRLHPWLPADQLG